MDLNKEALERAERESDLETIKFITGALADKLAQIRYYQDQIALAQKSVDFYNARLRYLHLKTGEEFVGLAT